MLKKKNFIHSIFLTSAGGGSRKLTTATFLNRQERHKFLSCGALSSPLRFPNGWSLCGLIEQYSFCRRRNNYNCTLEIPPPLCLALPLYLSLEISLFNTDNMCDMQGEPLNFRRCAGWKINWLCRSILRPWLKYSIIVFLPWKYR